MNCQESLQGFHASSDSLPSVSQGESLEYFRPYELVTAVRWYKQKREPTTTKYVSISRDKLVEALFKREVQTWRTETKFLSSVHDVTAHPSYKRIMKLGKAVVPFILRDLRENGGAWYFALRSITKSDPVRPEDKGYVEKMKEAWLEWGQKNHYV